MLKLQLATLLAVFALASALVGQTAMTNADLMKLSKAGLSEDFILSLVQQQPSALVTDAGRLVEFRNNDVSERIILAAARKTPPREPLTTSGLTQLVQAGFSDGFLIDLLSVQPVRISTDAANIVQLKQAGLSERVLAAIVTKGSGRELAKGTEIVVRLIDGPLAPLGDVVDVDAAGGDVGRHQNAVSPLFEPFERPFPLRL